MWKTAILLISALLIIPICTFYFDVPLVDTQLKSLKELFIYAMSIALLCFVIGELSGNNSQVDKLWSILPIFYVYKVFADSGYNARVGTMFILVCIWGVRLTYNFSRRGAYSWIPWQGKEDYRWEVLRKKPGLNKKWNWKLFHLFFVCIYQNLLILIFTLPSLLAWQGEATWNIIDLIACFGMLLFILLETIADQQQYKFQTQKYELINSYRTLIYPYSEGFCRQGLWSKVRHPNYSSEQAIWIFYYLFSVAATGRFINWTAVGFILLLLLFQGSSDFSESISAEKYPSYKDYQKQVPRFIPKLW